MDRKDQIIGIFAKEIRSILQRTEADFDEVQEIRLRVGAPLLLVRKNREYYVDSSGRLRTGPQGAYVVTKEELQETMEYISSYSLYAFEEELRQGFITIQAGTGSGWRERPWWRIRLSRA